MEDFFGGEMAVSKEQAAVIARGLYSLANVDGRVTQLKELQRMPDVDSAELARELKTPELRTLFMKTAILLAYADSNYSEKERGWVKKTGKELGFDEKELGRFDDLVRNFLLSQLSHIHNTDATAQVAKKLGY